MENYLSAEHAIVDRLKSLVPDLGNNVFTAADLDSIGDKQQITPAAHVLYSGDRVHEGKCGADGTGQMVSQLWYVVLVVRNAKATETSEAARQDAGKLIPKVLTALQGWRPSVAHSTMHRSNGVGPGFKAGYAYIPLLFTTNIVC